MSEKPITKREVREKIQEQAESITQLINPSDLIHQDIDSWEDADMDKLKEELHTNVEGWHGMAPSHPYENLIQELAVALYIEDMVRIPFDDLNHVKYSDRDTCVREGYWLYDMSNTEVLDRVHENKEEIDHFHEYESEAQMFVESCVIDAQIQELEE